MECLIQQCTEIVHYTVNALTFSKYLNLYMYDFSFDNSLIFMTSSPMTNVLFVFGYMEKIGENFIASIALLQYFDLI